jgi:hypothetical protein
LADDPQVGMMGCAGDERPAHAAFGTRDDDFGHMLGFLGSNVEEEEFITCPLHLRESPSHVRESYSPKPETQERKTQLSGLHEFFS